MCTAYQVHTTVLNASLNMLKLEAKNTLLTQLIIRMCKERGRVEGGERSIFLSWRRLLLFLLRGLIRKDVCVQLTSNSPPGFAVGKR